ncbi:MAG TPA: hydrogenase maturation protease [Oligoflexus sp.]|uniref:hydrogenase maturation protease n=1 Tax=Oligoflexus sp. TaxID=1971216 RepID=UPI002D7F9EB3|nr:hydrogenase maturation protease [Oligoflexus sp.]HET9240119.1 hydrogenase maturation protease [Oligoflexus sp.]
MEKDPFLIIALGHEYRRDDGFGAHVLRNLLKEAEVSCEAVFHAGDVSDLLERWNHRRVIVIDASESQGAPGRLHILKPLLASCLVPEGTVSSHGLGLAKTIELGKVLGKSPRELIVLTVEGQDFGSGPGLSSEVRGAVDEALSQLKKLVIGMETVHA